MHRVGAAVEKIGDQQPAPWPQHARRFGEKARFVGQTVSDLYSEQNIEGSGRAGEGTGVGRDELESVDGEIFSAPARSLRRIVGGDDPLRAMQAVQITRAAAAAGSNLKNIASGERRFAHQPGVEGKTEIFRFPFGWQDGSGGVAVCGRQISAVHHLPVFPSAEGQPEGIVEKPAKPRPPPKPAEDVLQGGWRLHVIIAGGRCGARRRGYRSRGARYRAKTRAKPFRATRLRDSRE